MAENYDGKISTLQVELLGDEDEQRLCNLVNHIFYTGKLCEVKNKIRKGEVFSDMVAEIHESIEEWTILENKILTRIEEYLNRGKYDFDGLDTCVGTLKYLTEVYSTGKDLKYLKHNKVNKLLNQAEKASYDFVDSNYDSSKHFYKKAYRKQAQQEQNIEQKYSDGGKSSKYKKWRDIKKVDKEELDNYLNEYSN